ncbi:MAG TPA: RNA polymerase sigma factor [Burkholderiales bacterium]|jgi:RNA polymerase sigma-70 factor (ECF subfamily)|nr:RNA polymerase sigma factor [Burkholderiales bacterium]
MNKPLQRASQAETSDAELARLVAGGDQAAFEAVMRRYNRALFRTARAILRDDAEAEDALQEAYLQVYRTMASYRGEARLSTWLARVVANEALMRLRKQTRRSAIVPLQPGVAVEEINEIAEGGMDKQPEAAARRAEMRKLLEERIDALPGAYRAVFMLRAVEEYSVEETANILQIPEATVRSRFFRARSLLREGFASEVDLACEDAFGFAGERCDRIVARVMQRLSEETR